MTGLPHHGTDVGPRVAVIGNTCAGKTTTARELARRLGVPHVEMDGLFWEPDWVQAPPEVFRERIDAATSQPAWVLDGGYSKVRDLVWPRATDLVWLDPPFVTKLWRLLARTTRRVVRQEELWNGNRERFGHAFVGRKSLLLWLVQTHGRARREYPLALGEPAHAHLRVVRLRSTAATRRWLDALGDAAVSR